MYKESESVELKSSFGEWKEIIITLSAFANKRGGTVIVGINEDSQPLHMQIGQKTIEDFVNKLKGNTDPILYPSINIKTFGLGEIVEIFIPPSDYKTVFAFDRAFIRVGKSNIKLSTDKLRELIVRYSGKTFDNQLVELGGNDFEIDQAWLTKLTTKGYHLSSNPSIAEFLCLTKNNNQFPQAIVKAARFKGDTPVVFIDNRSFSGGLLSITDQLLDFIRKNIRFKYVITGKAERDEHWQYPIVALREAILNALVHRDYNDPGNIQVRIFDNFIEIWSPGLLPKELDIANLAKNSCSIPRNKAILELFHLAGEIENWGTGFARINDACAANGNQQPSYEERAGAFVIRISCTESDSKSSDKSSDKILKLISEKPEITINELTMAMEMTTRGIEKQVAKLKNDQRIEPKGSKKEGNWVVKE
jgi:ATP-dependent DNA helicase RecG